MYTTDDFPPTTIDDVIDHPRCYTPASAGKEAGRRLLGMSARDLGMYAYDVLDQRGDCRTHLLDELLRVAIRAYVVAPEWQRSSQLMQAVKPVYEALHADICADLIGED